jgi:lysyl-tRNA synthetase class 2
MMHAIAGGATAVRNIQMIGDSPRLTFSQLPFITHHNDLDMDMYMRVAPELFLKKMIVGQFGKVFEIGKNFRNEGIDLTHNPEFTSCEFYWAYADVYDLMAITEELISGLIKDLTGSYITTFTTQHGETYTVNWEAPWRRVEMIPELEKATGEKFPPYDELHTEETNQFLQRVCKKMGVECPPPLTNARMIDKLTGEFIEDTCINPTFIRKPRT